MKIKITLLCLLITIGFSAKAQNYVTIPDANFVAWLQLYMPSGAMNGNQMDTTSIAVISLHTINVEGQGISNLDGIQYFDSLQVLECFNFAGTATPNHLTTLPRLPNLLIRLNCMSNQISNLPNLPSTLQELSCSNNQLTNIPNLPNSLTYLNCGWNPLTSLPILPSSMTILVCQYNNLNSLPLLPVDLLQLLCQNNNLVSLPPLPPFLEELYCNENKLNSLPSLPSNLKRLECHINFLTNIPPLPNSIYMLYCDENKLIDLPTLPNSLVYFSCNNNNISCFQTFPSSLYGITVTGNPVNCLPNYLPGMDSATLAYPLCVANDLINNPNGCSGAVGIVGTTYKDNNSNCTIGAMDLGLQNIPVKLYDNSNNLLATYYSSSNGIYDFPNGAGTYTVNVDTLGMPYYSQCTQPSNITLTVPNPLIQNVNFDVACKQGFDIGVQSITTTGFVFPGMVHDLSILEGDISHWYNFNCASGIGGQVQITVTGPVSYNGVASGALTPTVNGNVYTYTIADFGIITNSTAFGLLFTTDTTAQAGDQICVNVLVTPTVGDNNVSNNNYNYCYSVVNSYDPNKKEVYPIDVQPGFNDYFTYTIHFQNTGTAPAMNIRLVDTLDANLDLETFQVINYSHYNTASVTGNVLKFHFPNIQLPDSTSNLAGSQGFVQYRIKPKANLPVGTKIKNTANIYFDYNPAIVTNTTTNEYTLTASVNEKTQNTTLTVYPNPSNGKYLVSITDATDVTKLTIEVTNVMGETLLKTKMQNSLTAIDLSTLANGIYFVKINGSNQSLNQRIVKQ